MSAPQRTNGAEQVPLQYVPGTVARIFRAYDRELTRITAYAGTFTWDPASVVNGSSTSTTVTVPGVKVSVLAHVRVFAPYSLQGLQADGYVSADDTVTVTLYNNSGGAVDLASATWGLVVENFILTS